MMETRTAQAFVELADTLVAGFDVIDLLHTLAERCVDLLNLDAAGILLVDQEGRLSLVAASTEQAKLLELFQLQDEEGPCLECFRTGEAVICGDLTQAPQRWPRFATAAHKRGFSAVHALPIRLRNQTLGAMNLFGSVPGKVADDTIAVAQALADVVTISILQERAMQESTMVVEQLQGALKSRILIEQAKGVLAERAQIDVAEAFAVMRKFARSGNRKLVDVAAAVIHNRLDVAELTNRAVRNGSQSIT